MHISQIEVERALKDSGASEEQIEEFWRKLDLFRQPDGHMVLELFVQAVAAALAPHKALQASVKPTDLRVVLRHGAKMPEERIDALYKKLNFIKNEENPTTIAGLIQRLIKIADKEPFKP